MQPLADEISTLGRYYGNQLLRQLVKVFLAATPLSVFIKLTSPLTRGEQGALCRPGKEGFPSFGSLQEGAGDLVA